jgi:hypothetical protein
MDKLNPETEQKLERLLGSSFQPGPELSADFESRVMATIQNQQQKAVTGRKMLIVMSLYWSLASLIGAWVLLEKLPLLEASGYLTVFLGVIATVGAGVFFLVRQSKLKISDLFLQTIQ